MAQFVGRILDIVVIQIINIQATAISLHSFLIDFVFAEFALNEHLRPHLVHQTQYIVAIGTALFRGTSAIKVSVQILMESIHCGLIEWNIN